MRESLTPDDLIDFLHMPEGTAKYARAMEMFGKRGIDVMSLLSMQRSMLEEEKEPSFIDVLRAIRDSMVSRFGSNKVQHSASQS